MSLCPTFAFPSTDTSATVSESIKLEIKSVYDNISSEKPCKRANSSPYFSCILLKAVVKFLLNLTLIFN